MDCKECCSEMTALLDGELSQPLGLEVRSHIDACPACTEELIVLRQAADFVGTHYRKISPDPAGWDGVRTRLDTPVATRQHGRWTLPFVRWQPAIAIALTGFGVMIGLWSYQRQVESRRDLERYMTQYVQTRTAQEQAHRRHASHLTGGRAGYRDSQRSENPFLLIHQTADGNPFRR